METINYIKHLNGILSQFSKDSRLNPSHISLYMALFQIWNNCHFKPSFYINRAEVMDISKLGSKTTYHKSIRELSYWKYLLYEPSHNPFQGSKIVMFHFGTTDKQPVNPNCTNIETTYKGVVISKNKHIKTGKETIQTYQNEKIKQKRTVLNQDNLKASSDKDYNEPL